MKAIMIMFDSLSRRFLPPYGNDFIHAPNFLRLAEKTTTFDNSYVCSMPCMPARRDLHTGRPNFLHRSWGPIEPYDDSMPELLKNNGIYTHLITDHYHYWEDGGATYHSRYSSYEFVRGQEGDPWKAHVANLHKDCTKTVGDLWKYQDEINREYMDTEAKQSQSVTFELGMEFIRKNHTKNNWFLQIETFDPHEPFFVQDHFKQMYPDDYDGARFDWPPYAPVTETDAQVNHLKNNHFALISMCDKYLGKVIDLMDHFDLWEDTMLIVNTDHGFMLSEHGHWAKCYFPFFDEIAHTPLFIWDPRIGAKNVRRESLVQTIDIPPTILEFFSVATPQDMLGKALREVIAKDTPVRRAGIFGMYGGQLNITDGRYVYMRSPINPENTPLNEYWLMPSHHGWGRAFIDLQEIKTAALHPPFSFTKGCPLLKTNFSAGSFSTAQCKWKTALYDLKYDPLQQNPISDSRIENALLKDMVNILNENDCPPEQYERLGLI